MSIIFYKTHSHSGLLACSEEFCFKKPLGYIYEVYSLLHPCLPMLQLHLLPVFTGRAVGVAAAVPTVCTTPLAVLCVLGEGEAEQDACPPPKARSHSLKYQLCALHALLIHRVLLHAALHEEEHKCCPTALLCGQQPLGAAGQGLFQPSWLNPPANMSQSQAFLRPYC